MKILIVSQHIFPIQTPRSIRTTELAKEFSRQGHEVTIYAVLGKYNYSNFSKEYNISVKNISLKFQRKTYTSDGKKQKDIVDQLMGKLFGKLLEFPNIEFYYHISNIFKTEARADLLVSIADPHQIHWGCAKAKLKYPDKFPKFWIADCGDPFMTNGQTNNHLGYYSKFEKLFCSLCNYITVPIPEAINAYYPEYREKIKIIPQGFEFKTEFANKNKPNNKLPTFAFAGTFYKDIRNPRLFFDYLATIKTDFKFIIFTNYKELLKPYKKILKNKLEIKDAIERDKLIDQLQDMDFLVNLENENRPNQMPSKLIDYAIADRPILSINPSAINKQMINDFLSGNYSKQLKINNVEQYNIANIAKQFISLTND